MPIYLIFEFVGQDVHIFDVVLTTCKPPHHEAIFSSYIEIDESSLAESFELDEFQRMHLCKIYGPMILVPITLTPAKARTKIVYQVYISMFELIITNTIATVVPTITQEQLFDRLLLMVDKKKIKPEIVAYLEPMVYQQPIPEEVLTAV